MTIRDSACGCPRCRLGYWPASYTFGGRVPPQHQMLVSAQHETLVLAQQNKLVRRMRDLIAAYDAVQNKGFPEVS